MRFTNLRIDLNSRRLFKCFLKGVAIAVSVERENELGVVGARRGSAKVR